MKKTAITLILCAAIGMTIGCQDGSSEGTLSQQEVDSLNNPQKEMPKEAFEAMRNAGKNSAPSVKGDLNGDGVPDNRGEKAAPPPGG